MICTKTDCERNAWRRGLCRKHYEWALKNVPGYRIKPGDGDRLRMSDLLSQASITGRIHAERGGRCATDTCVELFGAEAARAYEDGYRREVARAGSEAVS